MPQLQEIENKILLQELRTRINKKKLSEKEVFSILESPEKVEVITEYKKVDLNKLTAEDWKKSCQALVKDKNYQEEIKLWESIDDE